MSRAYPIARCRVIPVTHPVWLIIIIIIIGWHSQQLSTVVFLHVLMDLPAEINESASEIIEALVNVLVVKFNEIQPLHVRCLFNISKVVGRQGIRCKVVPEPIDYLFPWKYLLQQLFIPDSIVDNTRRFF